MIWGKEERYEHETLESALTELSRIIGKEINPGTEKEEIYKMIGEFLNKPENGDRYIDLVEIVEYDD